jgi:hypothetical protein
LFPFGDFVVPFLTLFLTSKLGYSIEIVGFITMLSALMITAILYAIGFGMIRYISTFHMFALSIVSLVCLIGLWKYDKNKEIIYLEETENV